MKTINRSKIVNEGYGKNSYNLPIEYIEPIWIEALISDLDANRKRLDELIYHQPSESGSILEITADFKVLLDPSKNKFIEDENGK